MDRPRFELGISTYLTFSDGKSRIRAFSRWKMRLSAWRSNLAKLPVLGKCCSSLNTFKTLGSLGLRSLVFSCLSLLVFRFVRVLY